MGLLGETKFESLHDLLLHQLEDLYDAEQRLVSALPHMQEAADNTELKTALAEYQSKTKEHVERLDQVFHDLGHQPKRETCPAMRGLIQEAEEMVKAEGEPEARDAALIASAQRIEHYKIAAYGTIRQLAEQLTKQDVTKQAQANLDEAKKADEKLTGIANNINAAAAAKTA